MILNINSDIKKLLTIFTYAVYLEFMSQGDKAVCFCKPVLKQLYLIVMDLCELRAF